jgi:hypothetical protein
MTRIVNTRLQEAFHVLMECIDFLIPGWLDCVWDHYCLVHTVEPEAENLLPNKPVNYPVVKNSLLLFDFNPN